MSPGPKSLTLGCRLNAWESEVMKRLAREGGLEDAVVINTCAVTQEALRQSRKTIRKARRDHPAAELIVTGCAVQINPGAFAAMPEVDRVLGNREKLRSASFRSGLQAGPRVQVSDITAAEAASPRAEAPLLDGFEGRARAFLQVQTGCDHSCTFCIIPRGRGPSRSVPVQELVAAVRRLVEHGHPEVVLTGVDTTSYGADLPGEPRLGELVAAILRGVPELPRLRLSSVDIAELDAELLRQLGEEERLMPHLHLSLQSGDDLILKRMKRRHSRAEALAACERIRGLRPGLLFGADLIAGFPTEDDAAFENTLGLIDDCGLTFLHVFPFSPREGTPAARMPQVPAALVRERAVRLRAKGSVALSAGLDRLVGTTRELLVERGGLGHTPAFALARLEGEAPPPGTLLSARMLAREGDRLLARSA